MLALSTCWNSHRCLEGQELVVQARQAGFDAIEISNVTKPSLLTGLMQAFDAGGVRVVSVQAPTEDELTTADNRSRQHAIEQIKKTIETAVRFRCDLVILHLGSIPLSRGSVELERMALAGGAYSRPYIDLKLQMVTERQQLAGPYLERARAALAALLPVAEKHGVRLALETRHHFELVPYETELVQLLNEFNDCPWLGAWHDFGHVQRLVNLGFTQHEQYLRSIAHRLLGCHIHDVEWPLQDHLVPGLSGGIDYDHLLPLLPEGIPLVWEVAPNQRRAKLTQARIDWINRYGVR
jgi:sugar phosphate isomerase/epimerase